MSGNKLVDDFLTGGGQPQGSRHGSPPARFGGVGAGSASTSNMITIFTLQQRLLTVMNEAVGLVGQLQQLGVFSSDPDVSPQESAAEATQLLLASLLEQQRLESGGSGVAVSAPAFGVPPPRSLNTMTVQGAEGLPSMPAAVGGAARDMSPYMQPQEADQGGHRNHNNNNTNGLFAAPTREDHTADNAYGFPGAGAADDKVGQESGHAQGGAGGGGRRGGPRMLAFVEFKRNKVRKYACEISDAHPGTYVLVDGDRGTDCALLVQTIRYDDNGEAFVVSMDDLNIDDEKIKLENGRVLRAASNEDIDRLHNVIYNAEAVALKTCRQRCKELGIDIKVLDAEYQFDMKKISFYFDSDHSVDFRALVRELYRTFGARIWMENVNPHVKNAFPDARPAGGAGGPRRRN